MVISTKLEIDFKPILSNLNFNQEGLGAFFFTLNCLPYIKGQSSLTFREFKSHFITLLKVPNWLLNFFFIKSCSKLAAKSLAIPLTEAQSPLLGVSPILKIKSSSI